MYSLTRSDIQKLIHRPVIYALRVIFSANRIYPALLVARRILDGLMPPLQVFAVATFIDTVLKVAAKNAPWQAAALPLCGIGAILFYTKLSGTLAHFVSVRLTNVLREKIGIRLLDKYARMAWKNLENTDTADLIERVTVAPEDKFAGMLDTVFGLVALVITVTGLISIVVTHAWWAGVLIVAVTTPLFWLAIKSGKANYDADRLTTKYRRRYEYLAEVLAGRDAVEERTLFGYGALLDSAWKSNYETARKIIYRVTLRWFAKNKSGGVIVSLISLLIILALLPSVFSRNISIGLFMALINAVFSLVQRLSWDLTFYMDELAKLREYIRDFQKFEQLEETTGAGEKPVVDIPAMRTLEFVNVSFRYPGTTRLILDNISFKIRSGKHYAFVGLNGAGKTTIIKLISGLYREFEGEILVNGESIRNYDQRQLSALCAVAWQDFSRYQLSFRENIMLGNINAQPASLDAKIDSAVSVLDLAETVKTLPAGLDSPLGKLDKNGVDLSGGQWQRLALARFMINPAQLRILDEPTAALDPVSESNLYEQFEHISRGQTTVFISHRLGSTKLANHIFVIDGGKVAEEGTHAGLMAQAGIYHNLYESQRGWYQ